MKQPVISVDPCLGLVACVPTERNTIIDWHVQHWDGICLHTEGTTTVGLGDKKFRSQENTLFFVRKNVKRGSWNSPDLKPPKLWCLMFAATDRLYENFPHLCQSDPMKMVWRLAPDQVAVFKGMFVKLVAEQASSRPVRDFAMSGWLLLLLTELERWASQKKPEKAFPEKVPQDVLELWEKVNEQAMDPGEGKELLRESFPNYNSLRHRFKKAFGMSPQQMIHSLRIEHAKHLLMETDLSMKEIAMRIGYARQHEFTRAFHKQVGASPSHWRVNPTLARPS